MAWSEKVDEYIVEIGGGLFRMMFEDADERRLLLDAVDTLIEFKQSVYSSPM